MVVSPLVCLVHYGILTNIPFRSNRKIKIESIFSKYRIQSNSNNEITMFLSSEALLAVLRSASSNPSSLTSTIAAASSSSTVNPITRDASSGAAGGVAGGGGANPSGGGSIETEEVIMRLTKKNDQAMLTFDISGATRMGRAVHVMHDVRIEVMRPADVARMNEPMCPEPDVSCAILFCTYSLTDCMQLRFMSSFRRCRNSGRSSKSSGPCRVSWLSERTRMVFYSLGSTQIM